MQTWTMPDGTTVTFADNEVRDEVFTALGLTAAVEEEGAQWTDLENDARDIRLIPESGSYESIRIIEVSQKATNED